MKLRVLDLFSGIGAYSLGLERTGGFETVAFCEINAYCRSVLFRHWPSIPRYSDVRDLGADRLAADGIGVDWIVGGWPCQGNSPAGTGLGMDDPRSGLWSEIARLAGEIRPRGLLLENSSNLLNINDGADFGRVLGDLAALGYDAEWHCLSAAAFDAPHIRDRVWIIATLADATRREPGRQEQWTERERVGTISQSLAVADANSERLERAESIGEHISVCTWTSDVCGSLPHAAGERCAPRRAKSTGQRGKSWVDSHCGDVPNTNRLAPVGTAIARQQRHTWEPEPEVGRVATGVADRVEQIHALGNLNPPIIPELIGRAILESMAA